MGRDERAVRPRVWGGVDSPPVRIVVGVALDSGRDSRGMRERAVRSGAPSVHNDLVREPQPPAQNEVLTALGYRAAAALPLLIDGTAIGVISLFSSQPEVFDAAEVDVLFELTANLAFALQYLEKDEP